MTRVLVFGSFDVLHEGHRYFFRRARELGDELFVVVARDSTIRAVKKQDPKYNENERLKQVQEVSYVDRAVLGNEGDKLDIIELIKPNIIVLGYDQDSFTEGLAGKLVDRGLKVKIVGLPAYKPEIFKSSLLKG